MLGDKIGEESGTVVSRRVLPGDADMRYVRMEMTFVANGTLYGVPGEDTGTITIVERGPGQIYGTGQGMFMSAEGDGVIWNGLGVGTAGPDGVISFAAAVTYQTSSAKLSKLNGLMGMVENKLSMAGDVSSTSVEWKPA